MPHTATKPKAKRIALDTDERFLITDGLRANLQNLLGNRHYKLSSSYWRNEVRRTIALIRRFNSITRFTA